MQLTEYASVFLCSLHAEMTGTQILQGRCNLTSEIVGNRLHKCGLCLPGGSQQRLWFAQHFGWKANWARWPRHMISVEKMLGNPPRIACASLLAGHASRSPHWHFELLGIAQKQRLLRYSTLQYTKYCGGLAPCIRYLLANFPAFWFIRDTRINFESIRL